MKLCVKHIKSEEGTPTVVHVPRPPCRTERSTVGLSTARANRSCLFAWNKVSAGIRTSTAVVENNALPGSVLMNKHAELVKSLEQFEQQLKEVIQLNNTDDSPRVLLVVDGQLSAHTLDTAASLRIKFKNDGEADGRVVGVSIRMKVEFGTIQMFASQRNHSVSAERFSWKTNLPANVLEISKHDPEFEPSKPMHLFIQAQSIAQFTIKCEWMVKQDKSEQFQITDKYYIPPRLKDKLAIGRAETAAQPRVRNLQMRINKNRLRATQKPWCSSSSRCSDLFSSIAPSQPTLRPPRSFVHMLNDRREQNQMKASRRARSSSGRKANVSAFDMWRLHQEVVTVTELGGLPLDESFKVYQKVTRAMMPPELESHKQRITFNDLELAGMSDQRLAKEKIVHTSVPLQGKLRC